MKRFLDDPRDIPGVLNQVMMLGDRPRHLDHRRFLKRIGADDMPGNLAGDGDQRHGIHLGVGQAGDQVERPGPGSRHHHAGLAAGPGISLGREDAPLLVARQDRPNPVAVSRQRLVQRHARAARIREDDLDTVPHQRLDQNVRPGDRPRRGFGQGQAIVDGGHGVLDLGANGLPYAGRSIIANAKILQRLSTLEQCNPQRPGDWFAPNARQEHSRMLIRSSAGIHSTRSNHNPRGNHRP